MIIPLLLLTPGPFCHLALIAVVAVTVDIYRSSDLFLSPPIGFAALIVITLSLFSLTLLDLTFSLEILSGPLLSLFRPSTSPVTSPLLLLWLWLPLYLNWSSNSRDSSLWCLLRSLRPLRTCLLSCFGPLLLTLLASLSPIISVVTIATLSARVSSEPKQGSAANRESQAETV